MRVVEHRAAVVVDEALGRSALGQDHVVAVQLDMHVVDPWQPAFLHDRGVVDEAARRHQNAIEPHGVLG